MSLKQLCFSTVSVAAARPVACATSNSHANQSRWSRLTRIAKEEWCRCARGFAQFQGLSQIAFRMPPVLLFLLFAVAAQGKTATPPRFLGNQVTLNTGSTFINPARLTVDSSSDVFVIDSGSMGNGSQLVEIVAVNGSIPASPTIQILAGGQSVAGAGGIAIDSKGNLYYTLWTAVYQVLAAGGYQTVNQICSTCSFSNLYGIAVDASDNIFVSDGPSSNTINKLLVSETYSQAHTVITDLAAPLGIAVDAIGNVFVADNAGTSIKKFTLSAGIYSVPNTLGFSYNQVVTLNFDTSGNLYAFDAGTNSVWKILASSSYAVQYDVGTIPMSQGATVNANGNVFVAAGNGPGSVYEIETESVNFGSVNYGTITAAVLTVGIRPVTTE
jgi:hypothetical protein